DRAAARLLAQARAAQADAAGRVGQVAKLLAASQAALAAGDLATAARAVEAAAQLAPADPAVDLARRAPLGQAQDLDRLRRASPALVKSGLDALAGKRFGEAITAFTAARGLNPGEPTIEALLGRALRERDAWVFERLPFLLDLGYRALKRG